MLKTAVIAALVVFPHAALAQAQGKLFQGFHVGGYGGGTVGSAHARTSTVVTATAFDIPAGTYFQPTSPPAVEAAGSADLNLTAFAAGGQVGYNRSSGRFVFGGEADVSAMQLSGSATTTAAYPCCPTNNFTIKQSVDTDWLFSARLHFGYVFGEWLLSGTGGLAMTKLAYRANFSDTFTASESAASDDIQVGWTAGGSVEHRMNTHWSLKATYLYAAFGETTVTSTNLKQSNGATFPNTPFNHAVDLKVHTLRLGLQYRF